MVRAWFHIIERFSRQLSASQRGGVALLGALSLSAMVGMGAFAVEASQGYATKVSNQRTADMAALAGALAYNASSDQTVMQKTAEAVVKASGLAATTVSTVLTTDAGGNSVVKSTVTTQVPLALGKMLAGGNVSYDVVSAGMASTSATVSATPPCIAALSGTPTYGITLSGGTLIDAPGCAINTNAGVTIPNGTRINAKQVSAGKAIANGSPGIVTSPTAGNYAVKSNPASDWMLGSDALKQALCKVNKLVPRTDSDYADGNTACINQLVVPATIAPVGGAAQSYTTGYRSRASGYDAYQTGEYTCKYVFPAGDYEFRDFVITGGCDVTFGNGNLKFNSLDMSGGTMTVGNGSFTVVNEFKVNANVPIVIGNGAHSFGTLNILGGKKLDLGSGNFYVVNGISVSGGAYLKAAIGVGQTVTIGPILQTSGNSITVSGGSQVCFTADCTKATAAAGLFSANSAIVNDGGGSLIVFPKSETHIINGNLSLSSGAIFSPGLYVVNGNFTNGTGDQMSGTDITFVLAGTIGFSGGTKLDLVAPGSTSSYGIGNVLIATKTTLATKIGGGATGKYSGLVYAPKSDLTVDGGASMSSGTACMMLIVNTLSLNGGTSAGSSCTGISSGSASVAKVALVK